MLHPTAQKLLNLHSFHESENLSQIVSMLKSLSDDLLEKLRIKMAQEYSMLSIGLLKSEENEDEPVDIEYDLYTLPPNYGKKVIIKLIYDVVENERLRRVTEPQTHIMVEEMYKWTKYIEQIYPKRS